jgi:hypothetical protein
MFWYLKKTTNTAESRGKKKDTMKTILSKRYRGLDGIVNAAFDATVLTAFVCLALIATI